MNINANLSALKMLQQNMNGLGSVGSPLDALFGGAGKGGDSAGPLSMLKNLGQDSPLAQLLQGGASHCGGSQDAQQAMSVLQEVQGQEDDGDDTDLG